MKCIVVDSTKSVCGPRLMHRKGSERTIPALGARRRRSLVANSIRRRRGHVALMDCALDGGSSGGVAVVASFDLLVLAISVCRTSVTCGSST